MLKVTGSAYDLIKRALEEEKKTPDETLFVRLSMGIGWGGPELKLSLEERPITNDEIYPIEDIQFIIQPRDMVYFNQTKLDYVRDVLGKGSFKLIKI